jgi:hypothetical protein
MEDGRLKIAERGIGYRFRKHYRCGMFIETALNKSKTPG